MRRKREKDCWTARSTFLPWSRPGVPSLFLPDQKEGSEWMELLHAVMQLMTVTFADCRSRLGSEWFQLLAATGFHYLSLPLFFDPYASRHAIEVKTKWLMHNLSLVVCILLVVERKEMFSLLVSAAAAGVDTRLEDERVCCHAFWETRECV